jgi:diguanylate cyclase (GGDEF)-like protein
VDLGARYGGEEFAVVLPGATAAEAGAVAERLRAACEQLDSGLPPFTVSIGVMAQRPAMGEQVGQFQECADKALYQAKMNGRNCVVLAPGLTPPA